MSRSRFIKMITSQIGVAYSYILEGQSNAEGAAYATDLPSDLAGTINNAFIYNFNTPAWEGLSVGNARLNTFPGAAFGCELKLMKLLGAYYKKGQFLYKYAVSGTALAAGSGSDWAPASSGELFSLSNANYTAAKAVIPIVAPLKAYIWNQWEQDGANSTTANAYGANETSFIAAKRSFYALPNLPFIAIRASSSSTSGFKSTIQTQQDSIFRYHYNSGVITDTGLGAGKIDNTWLVNSNAYELQGDFTHNTAAGYAAMAIDLFDIITRL